jgi:hypothetical protein
VAATAQARNLTRRLARIRKDGRYSRLPKYRQRQLDDLVTVGRGKEAREYLAFLDEARRAHRRELARERRMRKLNSRVVEHVLRLLSGYNPSERSVWLGVSLMPEDVKRTVLRMHNADEYRNMARRPPKITHQLIGQAWNPFWYH